MDSIFYETISMANCAMYAKKAFVTSSANAGVADHILLYAGTVPTDAL